MKNIYKCQSPSTTETMINTNSASWKQNTYPSSPMNTFPVCSLIQSEWSDASKDPDCICPVGNKASNTINGVKTYKCQIPFPTTS